MNLAEMLDDAIGPARTSFLPDVSPSTSQVAQRTYSEERANLLIGHLYWQSYTASEALLREVPHHLIKSALGAEPLVVFHGDGLFSLLFETQVVSTPAVFRTSPSADELTDGLFRYLSGGSFPPPFERHRASSATIRSRQRVNRAFDLSPSVLRDIREEQPFYIAFAPLPAEEQTSIPVPALAVVGNASPGQISTAGCWVQDRVGRLGVTAAAHAVPPSGAAVTLGTYSGTVVAHDLGFTDSAFVEVPVGKRAFGKGASRTSSGPLQKAPRPNEVCSFEGITSGPGQAKIQVCNLEIPTVDLDLQQTVRTDRVTAIGDSGAALIDNDGFIVGFAHKRSAGTASPTWSSWIWAGAVFQKHRLSIV